MRLMGEWGEKLLEIRLNWSLRKKKEGDGKMIRRSWVRKILI